MKKIFPYYKGENLSKTPLGYTNKANARRRMYDFDVVSDFKKTLPEDYWLHHYYVKKSEEWSEDFGPNTNGISTTGLHFGITIYTRGYRNINTKTEPEDLPEDVRMLFEKKFWAQKREDKGEYRRLVYEILRKGWSPIMYEDYTDWKRRLKKYIDENVEFREVDVEIVTNDTKKDDGHKEETV